MTTVDLDSLNLDEVLESVKQDQANYVPRSNEPIVEPSKPIWGNPMDWLSLGLLILVLVDHIRKQVMAWMASSKKNARDSGLIMETQDEQPKSKTMRNRKKGKKSKNQLKQREEKVEAKPIKKTAPLGINFYDLAKVYAVVTMIIDHYGYFGLPGISYTMARWTRVIAEPLRPCSSSLPDTADLSDSDGPRGAMLCFSLLLMHG